MGWVMIEIVLAIDPGVKKCGVAVVDRHLKFKIGKVLPNEILISEINTLLLTYQIGHIVIGNGTNSEKIIDCIQRNFPAITISKVAEKYTTMQARKRYFDVYAPTGLLKILPATLRIPPRPYDDFAALLIAENFLNSHKENE